ncbi:hypothetical protein Salat_1883600 [Sesamum alatum]|uniref:Uncharacterized protein n=1 Tax=Sesamum alatum TaxID=300844 RepID=A0AAE1Y3D8_9LAMI|nr:hypothetical protein Salat_1883600 [Sesamum alatum]
MASSSTVASPSNVSRPDQQQNFSPDAATVIPESTNCLTPADPPPPPTPAAPLVKRSYSNVVQHNSTTRLQFDLNRKAKKTFHEDECGTMRKVSYFKGDPEVERNDPIFVVNHDDALDRGLIVTKKVQEQNVGNKDKELASENNNRPKQELIDSNIMMEK